MSPRIHTPQKGLLLIYGVYIRVYTLRRIYGVGVVDIPSLQPPMAWHAYVQASWLCVSHQDMLRAGPQAAVGVHAPNPPDPPLHPHTNHSSTHCQPMHVCQSPASVHAHHHHHHHHQRKQNLTAIHVQAAAPPCQSDLNRRGTTTNHQDHSTLQPWPPIKDRFSGAPSRGRPQAASGPRLHAPGCTRRHHCRRQRTCSHQ